MNCQYCGAQHKPTGVANASILWFECGTMYRRETPSRADQTAICAEVERFEKNATIAAQSKWIEKLEAFACYVRDNYDCDEDAHRYNTACRCCDAAKLVGVKP